MPRRFERGLSSTVRVSGDAVRRLREAAAYPVKVCRPGQRGVQKEDEQKEGHAPCARPDRCPALPL